MTDSSRRALQIGFLEPHLLRYGGIRRIVELGNHLVARGHSVSIYLPPGADPVCRWLPCRALVRTLPEGCADHLDVIIFNNEPQAHLLALFSRARARVFYALAYSALYSKPGSWDASHADTDLVIANSSFVAAHFEKHLSYRPPVVLGGINSDIFHPVISEKMYAILCVGDKRRWKGTAIIEDAARLLHLPLESYATKNLAQSEMAREYCRAEVFAVGSPWEGFGWPGLEALACGVPLVTTDNGGCREYAIPNETAIVVPRDDSQAMAAGIGRVRQDPQLAADLVANGQALVEEKFQWPAWVDMFEECMLEAVERSETHSHERHRPSLRPQPSEGTPNLSIVVLAWDLLRFTQRCVESIRQHTDVSYELIIVDNGSEWEAANYAREASDRAVSNTRNVGFAGGMNQGLALATGRYVAFINNDTRLPPGWATLLLEHLATGDTGIVVPAVTSAHSQRMVRTEPGESVEVLDPFEPPPSAVVFVMRTAIARDLGGWDEHFPIASGEDTDLAFRVWANGLNIVFDSRVLVDHKGKATASEKLSDWRAVWGEGRKYFLEKWQDPDLDVPRLESCSEEEFAYNLRVARSVAGWMERWSLAREKLKAAESERKRIVHEGKGIREVRNGSRRAKKGAKGLSRTVRVGHRAWPYVGWWVPGWITESLRRRYGTESRIV